MDPITPHESTIRIWTAREKPYAIIPIDIMTDGLRETFHLMIDIYRTAEGIGRGEAACLNATATVIDGRKPEKHPLVMFGQVIHTPFGDFIPQPGRYRNPRLEILPFQMPE